MIDLFKGVAGSPITYLTSDISANQTTISIADDSALPDAPNICTIGYGEHLETIKYENKSNGVLQNVTRGIEGTPRAWPAGTEVARFFTAYDHNEIIDGIVGIGSDLETHKAESVAYVARVERDASLNGIQRISVPFKAKSIIAVAHKGDLESIGFWAENNNQYVRYWLKSTSSYAAYNAYIIGINDGANATRATIKNVTDDGFDIEWFAFAGTLTGNIQILLLVNTH